MSETWTFSPSTPLSTSAPATTTRSTSPTRSGRTSRPRAGRANCHASMQWARSVAGRAAEADAMNASQQRPVASEQPRQRDRGTNVAARIERLGIEALIAQRRSWWPKVSTHHRSGLGSWCKSPGSSKAGSSGSQSWPTSSRSTQPPRVAQPGASRRLQPSARRSSCGNTA